MKTMFNAACVGELKQRLDGLSPGSSRHWGKMDLDQMLAHCSKALEMAAGELRPRRVFVGRIIGRLIKRVIVSNDKPMHRDSPTAKELLVTEEHNFAAEKERLSMLIDRFVAAGPSGCTSHPHAFFGPLNPDEWGILMYKHLDHHLRQFGA